MKTEIQDKAQRRNKSGNFKALQVSQKSDLWSGNHSHFREYRVQSISMTICLNTDMFSFLLYDRNSIKCVGLPLPAEKYSQEKKIRNEMRVVFTLFILYSVMPVNPRQSIFHTAPTENLNSLFKFTEFELIWPHLNSNVSMRNLLICKSNSKDIQHRKHSGRTLFFFRLSI